MQKKISILAQALGLLFVTSAMAAPALSISETKVDFGSLTEGPVASKTVTLTNMSKEVITIQNVISSCSCTTTALGQSSINPGESAKLTINYNTFKYPGKFDKTVTVVTGNATDQSQLIHIVGDVQPMPMGEMEIVPRKIILEGLIAGKKCTAKIVLKNTGNALMTVSKIESHKFKTVYWKGIQTIPAGKSAQINFMIAPQNKGKFMDILFVHSDARNDIGNGYKAVLIGDAQ